MARISQNYYFKIINLKHMPFKKGVASGGGKKGRSGRKPIQFEFAQAQDLHDIWTGKKTKEQLQKIIESGKYGAREVFAAKAMSGDMRALNKLADKLYANKNDVTTDGEKINQVQEIPVQKQTQINNALDMLYGNTKDKKSDS